jgi:recombinational DNA repair ATPase RecF
MWIERVMARAFGGLRDQRLDLGPGLNVIHGPNEAGKSTWHAAIRMALTGVRRGRGSSTREASALEDRHRPWDDRDRWAVEALVHVGDRRIDIVQDLLGKVACRATDVDLGIDVSAEITRPDGTPDASIWLGLDREAFATTLSVGQGEMLAVADNAAALQEHMQRAAAAHGTDATAAGAIERLREHRKKAVGADTTVAKGPLRAAMREVAAREAELADARRRHAEYLARQADADAAANALATAERQLWAVRLAAARAAATALRQRFERAAELGARYPTSPPPLATRDEQADAVAAALSAWRSRPTPAAATGRPVADIEAELVALPDAPTGDVQPAGSVVMAVRELGLAEEAERAIGEAAQMPSASQGRSNLWSRWALVGVALLLAAGLVALIAGAPLVTVVGTVLALVVGAWLAFQNRSPRSAGQLRDRADLLTVAQARTAAARTGLALALHDRGVAAGADLHLAAAEYEAACRARAGQAAAAARAPGLRRELDAARDAGRLVAEAARLEAEAEAGLRAVLARVTLGSESDLPVATVVGRLEAWQGERSVSTAEAEQSIREFEELTGLLNGRSVDDLGADAARSEQLVQQLAVTVGPHPEIESGTDEATAAAEVDRLRETAAALSGAADARQVDLVDVAAAEEAALAAHERLRRVTELAEVIDETLGLLEAAQRQVHRDLAPILAAAIREWLPVLSGGAYTDAGVNPADLSIEVKERGTGAWRQARLLSGGTREQIYLLLRVAMAEHLVTTRERAPLLLDEVTAQADKDRERAILDMLLSLATDRQLILFTHDDAVLSWAETHLHADRHRIVRLSSPSGQPVDASAEVITIGSGS